MPGMDNICNEKVATKAEDVVHVYDPASLPNFLPLYYKFLFPYKPYFSWLSYGGVEKNLMSGREFSFTLQNDIYVRYQSFSSQQEMEKEIQKINPYKIDIGAVYSRPPKDHNKYHGGVFKAVEKELVFDIDMTDYDDVRKCCQGADICEKCWPLMKIAIKLINRALKDDFGFKHRLWVYSGRRGVHCWVCDEKARKLTNSGRAAVAEYLSVIQGGNYEKRVHLKDPVHPFLRHCIKIISSEHWEEYRELQDLLAEQSDIDKVLKMIPDTGVREDLAREYGSTEGSTELRWLKLREVCAKRLQEDMKKYKKLQYTTQEIMLEFCYPRLDINVSKGLNHLLKSPFCVHPKTGRVCVPIDADNVDDFDPFQVPTISELCQEMDSIKYETKDEAKSENVRKTHFYNKTRLAEPVKLFEDFVRELVAESRKQVPRDQDSTHDF